MADISGEIAAFKNAAYGEDVREAMVSLANKLNNTVTNAADAVDRFSNRMSTAETTIEDHTDTLSAIDTSTNWANKPVRLVNEDLNDITTGGRYYWTNVNLTNSPINGSCTMLVLGGYNSVDGPALALQLVFSRIQNKSFYRIISSYNNNQWSEWFEFANATMLEKFSSLFDIWDTISFIDNEYIDLTVDTIDLTPIPNINYKCINISCETGDVFIVNASRNDLTYAYAFLNSGRSKIVYGSDETYVNHIIVAPYGATRLIINTTDTDSYCYRVTKQLHFTFLDSILSNSVGIKNNVELILPSNYRAYVNISKKKGQTVVYNIVNNGAYDHYKISCEAGDTFHIKAGAGLAGIYAFIDLNYVTLETVYLLNTTFEGIITAPADSNYLLVNNNMPDGHVYKLNNYSYTVKNGLSTNNQMKNTDLIYGIRINDDGTVDRIGRSAYMRNNYLIGNTFAFPGVHNDFDDVLPWSGIKRCNVFVDNNGDRQIIYDGQPGFTSSKDILVEIPSFYTKREYDHLGRECIYISPVPNSGFEREPAFYDSYTGEEIDKIYVGSYFSSRNDILDSKAYTWPLNKASFIDARNTSEMLDFVTVSALRKLVAIEFGMIDITYTIGGYSQTLFGNNGFRSTVTASGATSATFRTQSKTTSIYERLLHLATNRRVMFINGVSGEITTDKQAVLTSVSELREGSSYYECDLSWDTPQDLIANDTTITGYPQKNGNCIGMPYHTGRLDNGLGGAKANEFQYRYIENLWGTLGEYMDGIKVVNLVPYWHNIKPEYDDLSKYHKLNYILPNQEDYSGQTTIKKMGLDFRNQSIMLPIELTEDQSGWYNDGFYSHENGTYIGITSMAWDGNVGNGLFTTRFWASSFSANQLYGTRMIIRTYTQQPMQN